MNGKYNYNHPKTVNRRQKYIKDYQITGNGKSFIIYVFDKDLNVYDYRDAMFEKEVTQYCNEKAFLIIWFVKTIEDVLWGYKIDHKDKKDKALQFIKRNQIQNVKQINLKAHVNVNASHKSNALTVLNKFSQIKKI
jgi:hypothetical protein